MTTERGGRADKGPRRQVPIRMPVALADELAAAAKRYGEPRGEIVCAVLHGFFRSGRGAQRKIVGAWLTRRLPASASAKGRGKGGA